MSGRVLAALVLLSSASCIVPRSAPPVPAAPSVYAAPPAPAPATPVAEDPAVGRGILRRAGAEIVDGAGTPVRLRGIAFGNQVWSSRALPVHHHAEADFQRVRAMGM